MENLIETGQITALISFVLGTILLSFYLYFGEPSFPIELAVGFIIAAIIFNTVLFLVLFGAAILNPKYRLELLKTCGIMLMNIPISILYFYILFTFPFRQTVYETTF